MKSKTGLNNALRRIYKGRQRTNLLKKYEQAALAFLVQILPAWVKPDMLTALGFFGNLIVGLSFVIAKYFGEMYLLLGVAGFAISWFGDSLDGRLAYYRNRPRKWYGFSLDLITDWLGIIIMGAGFIVYAQGVMKIFGYFLVTLYAWEMIIALVRYKVTDNYSIDSGVFGPTEVRIIFSLVLILEVLFNGVIYYFAGAAVVGLIVAGIVDTIKLLKSADNRDKNERKNTAAQ
jgi:phosphatidylglycerophosphate synthase